MIVRFTAALLCFFATAASVFGDSDVGHVDRENSNGIRLDKEQTQRWKVGMIVTAPASPCAGIFGTATVPTDWPEQRVRIVEEDFSEQITSKNIKYRTLENGVKKPRRGDIP